MVLVDVDPTAGLRAAAMPGLEPSPPEPPRKSLPRGRRALSYWADVLMNCNCGTPPRKSEGRDCGKRPMRMRGRSRRSNWNPPRKSEGRNCGARPMRGRSRRSPRSVALAYSPSRRKGKTRRGSRQRPPRRGKGKSLLRPMLRRRPTTSNADELDAVPASAEGTPLHRTPFLSVG